MGKQYEKDKKSRKTRKVKDIKKDYESDYYEPPVSIGLPTAPRLEYIQDYYK